MRKGGGEILRSAAFFAIIPPMKNTPPTPEPAPDRDAPERLTRKVDQLTREVHAVQRDARADRERNEAERQRERERNEALVRAAEENRRAAEASRKAAEADRDRAYADREQERERNQALVRAAEANARAAQESRQLAEANARAAEADRDRAKADRDRVVKLEADNKEAKGHRHNLARALEDAFANSLPRVMNARGIRIAHDDIRTRVRRNNHSREFDFVAPNGELTLVGEVKTHLTREDVEKLLVSVADFRQLFPEYAAGKPVYGVVCGGLIDEDAARLAYQQGFIILRMEGAELHPASAPDFAPKAY